MSILNNSKARWQAPPCRRCLPASRWPLKKDSSWHITASIFPGSTGDRWVDFRSQHCKQQSLFNHLLLLLIPFRSTVLDLIPNQLRSRACYVPHAICPVWVMEDVIKLARIEKQMNNPRNIDSNSAMILTQQWASFFSPHAVRMSDLWWQANGHRNEKPDIILLSFESTACAFLQDYFEDGMIYLLKGPSQHLLFCQGDIRQLPAAAIVSPLHWPVLTRSQFALHWQSVHSAALNAHQKLMNTKRILTLN